MTISSSVAFKTIEKGNEQANSSVGMIDEINTVLVNIVDKMSGLNEITQKNSGSANQQIMKISSLGDGVTNIDASAEENATSSSEILIAPQRLIDLSSQLINQINVYKTH